MPIFSENYVGINIGKFDFLRLFLFCDNIQNLDLGQTLSLLTVIMAKRLVNGWWAENETYYWMKFRGCFSQYLAV